MKIRRAGRVVPCGQTGGHNEAKVAFRNFANAPKTVFMTYRQTSFFTAQKNVHNTNEDLGVCVPRSLRQQLILNSFHNCVYHLHFVHTEYSSDSHKKQRLIAQTALIFVTKIFL